MSAGSHKDIALHYFCKVDDAVWECNEYKVRRKQIHGSGYNNLYTHITAKHTDYREKVLSKNSKLTFVASPRAVIISTLLAFSPLIDATDFTSEKQAEFIKWNLSVFNKAVSNLIFKRFSTDSRKKMLPKNFEMQMFLFANKPLWNVELVESIIADV